MAVAKELEKLIQSGVHQIGELELQSNVAGFAWVLSHLDDAKRAAEAGFGGLEVHTGSGDARDLSTHAEDGSYRFAKGQTNLKRGWVMTLRDVEELRLALDQFYPAAVGLYLAQGSGFLETENLRDKLNRQTGMYRFARNISDAGAQRLVREVCGPAHQCARKILWKIDEVTPLEDSEASRYSGIPDGVGEAEAIPLLCREACNHFVSECRRVSKEEAGAKRGEGKG